MQLHKKTSEARTGSYLTPSLLFFLSISTCSILNAQVVVVSYDVKNNQTNHHVTWNSNGNNNVNIDVQIANKRFVLDVNGNEHTVPFVVPTQRQYFTLELDNPNEDRVVIEGESGYVDVSIVLHSGDNRIENRTANRLYVATGGGEDLVIGGVGNDYIYVGGGNDQVFGNEGDDFIIGSNGMDQLEGENGDDQIYGGNDDDFVDGGNGDDSIRGGNGNDSVLGGPGNDSLSRDAGSDLLDGEDGDDTLIGNNFVQQIIAGKIYYAPDLDDDELSGGDGNDTIHSGYYYYKTTYIGNLIIGYKNYREQDLVMDYDENEDQLVEHYYPQLMNYYYFWRSNSSRRTSSQNSAPEIGQPAMRSSQTQPSTKSTASRYSSRRSR